MNEHIPGQKDIFHTDHCWNRIGVWSEAETRCEKLVGLTHCRNCEVYRRAGREIFEREVSKNYLEYWSKIYAQHDRQDTDSYQSLIVFRLGSSWFALPSAALNEITRYRGLHHLPHRKQRFVMGLVNVRGRISLCYSLMELLGIEETPGEIKSPSGVLHVRRQLVLTINEEQYIFLVDEIAGVNRYSKSTLSRAPASGDVPDASLVTAVLDEPDKRIYVLDSQALARAIQGAESD